MEDGSGMTFGFMLFIFERGLAKKLLIPMTSIARDFRDDLARFLLLDITFLCRFSFGKKLGINSPEKRLHLCACFV